jgi:hypothetical protein
MTIAFMRNKVVEVEPRADGGLDVYWRLSDDLMDLEITMTFEVPDLEIAAAGARVRRSVFDAGIDAGEAIRKVEGVRVGPGLRKIVRGLLGGEAGSVEMTEGVLECCNAVILHFTLPGIQMGEQYKDAPEEEQMAFSRAMIAANPRLLRSCVAFADDSPIVQGLGLAKEEGGK